jgi:hypothetical protein
MVRLTINALNKNSVNDERKTKFAVNTACNGIKVVDK